MGTLAVWIMGFVFILVFAVIGVIYTIAWIVDLVWREKDD